VLELVISTLYICLYDGVLKKMSNRPERYGLRTLVLLLREKWFDEKTLVAEEIETSAFI
jgi:hypothetical protein